MSWLYDPAGTAADAAGDTVGWVFDEAGDAVEGIAGTAGGAAGSAASAFVQPFMNSMVLIVGLAVIAILLVS